jgi:hypothetical protein
MQGRQFKSVLVALKQLLILFPASAFPGEEGARRKANTAPSWGGGNLWWSKPKRGRPELPVSAVKSCGTGAAIYLLGIRI